jgi:hypothetical protein
MGERRLRLAGTRRSVLPARLMLVSAVTPVARMN